MATDQGQPPHQLRCNGCSSCCSISRKRLVAAGYALLAIGSRVGFFIVTPLWLDYFNPINSTSLGNLTHEEEYDLELLASSANNNNSTSCPRSSNPYFAALGQWTFSTLILGFGLLLIRLFSPRRIRDDVERSYPKRQFAIIGCSQGLSTMFMAFAISGSRTPPYLQAILANFALPTQFVVRFIVLRKRPGLVKAICAAVVTLSEFVCLIPTIFPSLESKKQHRQEGGSTGVDRFLWPAFFVASQIPFAVANSLMERSVQSEQKATTNSSPDLFTNNSSSNSIDNCNDGNENNCINNRESSSSCDGTSTAAQQQQQQQQAPHLQLDLIYFNFWWTLFVVATLVSLFWVDILPVIGTSSSLADFGCKMWFNLQCLFGAADCIGVIALLGWLDFCTVLLGNFAFAGLMRHSEGANFVMIVMTVRTPIIFIFWTLFVEQPFSWQPHASLGTWLSIGAIVVMVAAIVLYDRAPSEIVPDSERRRRRDEERISDDDDDDRQSLIGSQPSSAAVDDDDYDTSHQVDGSSSNHIRHTQSDQRS